jgi:hypothetical protein
MAATQKPAGLVPVGCVVAFLKNITGTPATLPSEFVECNGQTLTDPQSIYNGVPIPDLNGTNAANHRFLRGAATSGGTGGTETHHHGMPVSGDTTFPSFIAQTTDFFTTGDASTLPSYYEVVWVIRIK